MRTNIDIDDALINKALEISKLPTKKSVIDMLLREYVKKNKQREILKFRSSGLWEGDLDEMRAQR
jgi:Arc/MetJ family transcription regulator